MIIPPFQVQEPTELRSNLVFASPHSGAHYSEAFLGDSVLELNKLRSSEDAFVHDLYRSAPEYGAPLIIAGFPRAYIDLNRAEDELDPALIIGAPSLRANPRVASGLGIIPSVVSEGRAIRSGKISMKDAQDRIATIYRPYHEKLRFLMGAARSKFGSAILIDCHSMPHSATENMVTKGGRRPDIVLGDRYGASAPSELVDMLESAFRDEGFSVSRNVPFAGAFNLQHYGRPSASFYAVQIEIDRALYMDEIEIQKTSDYWDVKAKITRVVENITRENWMELGVAAE